MKAKKIVAIVLMFLLVLNLGSFCAFADVEGDVDENCGCKTEKKIEKKDMAKEEAEGEERPINEAFIVEGNLLEILKAGRSKTVYLPFPCYYTPGVSNNEASVGLTGTFTVDVANGNIISAKKPNVQLESFPHSENHTMSIENKRTSYTIINGDKIKFMASFTLVSDDGTFVPMKWEFSIYMTCDADGNIVDCSPRF